jgi:hypothetical protein
VAFGSGEDAVEQDGAACFFWEVWADGAGATIEDLTLESGDFISREAMVEVCAEACVQTVDRCVAADSCINVSAGRLQGLRDLGRDGELGGGVNGGLELRQRYWAAVDQHQ